MAVDKSDSLNISEALPSPSPTFERNLLGVAKGGGVIFAGKLFTQANRLVIAFLLARLLGAEQYGLYSLVISTGSVLAGLALLGLDTALVRYVAISISRRDEAGLWGVLQIGLGVSTLLSVLTGTALYALAFPIATNVFHEPQLASLLQLISVVVPFLTLSDILAGATRGFKNMQHTVIAQNIAQPLIRLVLTLALVFVGLKATQAIIIFGLADGAASVMLLFFLHRHFSLKRPLNTARRDTRTVLTFSLPVWLSDLMTMFHSHIQTLLLGAMNTITGVGIFTVVSQLNLIGGHFLAAVTTSAKPTVAELHDRGEREQLGRLYQAVTNWTFTMNLPLFLTMVLFPAQILSFFGKGFVNGATALVILAWANLADVGTGMCGAILEMAGYTKLKLANSIVRLVLTLSLNFLLIPRWGIVGAATTVLVGEGLINLLRVLEVFVLFRILPYNRSFLKPITAGLAALASVWVIGQGLPAEAPLYFTALQVLILFSVYAGVRLALGLNPEDRLLLTRLQRRVNILFSRR